MIAEAVAIVGRVFDNSVRGGVIHQRRKHRADRLGQRRVLFGFVGGRSDEVERLQQRVARKIAVFFGQQAVSHSKIQQTIEHIYPLRF